MTHCINLFPPHLLTARRRIQKYLITWYRVNKRNLPWRKTGSPYRIWISEVMLQQTQVKTVIPYYRRFLRRFPSLTALARARPESVLKLWEGLGYYRRAILLHQAAVLMKKNYRGRIPDSYEQLRTLPGFGEYTAGAVLSIAYHKPVPAVDGNVLRVFSRLLAIAQDIRSPETKKAVTDHIHDLIPEDSPSDFNQALMELGALICTPRKPVCQKCPVKKFCKAFNLDDPEKYPLKSMKKDRRTEPVSVGVIIDKGRCLINQRPPDVILPNLWEFPGGKALPGESPEEACLREVKEETGLDVKITGLITRFRHHYSHYSVDLHFFMCRRIAGKIRPVPSKSLKWVKIKELHRYPFPSSTRRVIGMLSE